MEVLNQVWDYLLPYIPTIISAVISTVMIFIIKSIVGKKLNSIDAEKVSTQATNACLNTIKGVSFVQSIEPLVKSELVKVSEQAKMVSQREVKNLIAKYDKIIEILQALKTYFDDSAFISQENKEKLQQKIDNAKTEEIPTEVETVVIIEQDTKAEVKTETNIER